MFATVQQLSDPASVQHCNNHQLCKIQLYFKNKKYMHSELVFLNVFMSGNFYHKPEVQSALEIIRHNAADKVYLKLWFIL